MWTIALNDRGLQRHTDAIGFYCCIENREVLLKIIVNYFVVETVIGISFIDLF